MYVCIYIYIYVCIYIYIYIYIARSWHRRYSLCVNMSSGTLAGLGGSSNFVAYYPIYIYIHIYIYIYIIGELRATQVRAYDDRAIGFLLEEFLCFNSMPCRHTPLHPVSVRRFQSFRTEPLENLSHYL